MKKLSVDSRGQALMQVLIAIPIVAIISLVIATMLSNMSREIRTVQQKMEIMQFENYMIQVFNDDSRCKQILLGDAIPIAGANPTTQSTQYISLAQLKQGATGITYVTRGQPLNSSSQVKVSDIRVGYVKTTTTPNQYQSEIHILWDTTNMPMSLKPIVIQKDLMLDGTGKVTDCAGGTGGSSGGTCTMVDMTSGCSVANDGATCGSRGYTKPEQQVTCNCPAGQHPMYCTGTMAGYNGPTSKSGTIKFCNTSGVGTLTSTGCSMKGYGAYSIQMSCCQ